MVPLAFAIPAGFSTSASPSSAEATAAPARDVEAAPAPGRSKPPAAARCGAPIAPTRNIKRQSFMAIAKLPEPCDARPALGRGDVASDSAHPAAPHRGGTSGDVKTPASTKMANLRTHGRVVHLRR